MKIGFIGGGVMAEAIMKGIFLLVACANISGIIFLILLALLSKVLMYLKNHLNLKNYFQIIIL